ncbi:hypothetical protein DFP73DRAFT_499594 [Morchella snyderi]|nr:hypothetical protein DFP73DRAFT_499594 [Morchella snyderi]
MDTLLPQLGTLSVQIPVIWASAGVVLSLLVISAAVFVRIFQDRHDRDAFVTIVCVLALSSLLATVCLLPVDIALVSITTNNATGLKKEWADVETVARIVQQLKIVYYSLYSLDATMCLLIIPFAYFWYEEWDVDTSAWQRIKGALKYSLCFVAFIFILMTVGLFIPVANDTKGHWDLDYFKKLLLANNGERILTFTVGALLCVGILPYVCYTAPGLALTPMVYIKSIPGASVTSSSASVHEDLIFNRERQRMIEAKYGGSTTANFTAKDRREMESLQREERTLVRRERIAEEGGRKGRRFLGKLKALGRPLEIIFGIFVLVVSLSVVTSMLLTSIDKSKNSVCGNRCGYILAKINLFNPINWLFVTASNFFPADYVLALLLVLLLFVGSVVGAAFVGIRFLWVSLFKIQTGHTKPQGMLLATVILTLMVLAINYAITIIIAPQYAHYGGQKFCNNTLTGSSFLDCSQNPELIVFCSESAPQYICTPTVVSTFINRVTLNFPFFGAFAFWGQFAFIGVYTITLLIGLIKTPRLRNMSDDEDDEIDEEESLLRENIRGQSGRSTTYGLNGRGPREDV